MLESIIQIISIFMSAGVTLTVCLINNKYQQNKTLQEVNERHDKEFQEFKEDHAQSISDIKLLLSEVRAEDQSHIALLTERIDVLSDRVEKHNNVMEKVYDLQTLAVKYAEIQKSVDEKLVNLRHDVDRLQGVS